MPNTDSLHALEVAMEVGEDAVDALSLLATLADVSQVEALAVAALSVLLLKQSEEEALSTPSFQALHVHFIKRTFSALVCLFLEAAKNDLSISQLSSFLSAECGLHGALVEALCSAFCSHKLDLTRSLSLTANHSYLPRLQGMDWSLRYCISSSEDCAQREFLYNIRFKTVDSSSGKEDGLEVTCSLEELQDLMLRLRDACKSVERVVDSR